MKKYSLKGFGVIFGIALLVLSLGPSKGYAESADYTVGISQKFGHGLLNVISSPLEIPCTFRDDVSEKGGAGIATGFFKGIAFFLRRALVGVTEVGTFVIPMEETLPPVCAKPPQAKLQ